MLHPISRKPSSKQKIINCLFDHKVAPASFISAMTKISIDTVNKTLHGAEFESIQIPISSEVSGKPIQKIWKLSKKGEQKIGVFRSPEVTDAAISMCYERLSATRAILKNHQIAGNLVWALSPWRPNRKMIWYDALVCMLDENDKCRLYTYITASETADPAWYVNVIDNWMSVVEENKILRQSPIEMVIRYKQMNLHLFNYLSLYFQKRTGIVHLMGPESPDTWNISHFLLFKENYTLYRKNSVYTTFLDKKRFEHEYRRSPYPVQKEGKQLNTLSSNMTAQLLPSLSQPDMYLMRLIGLYPTMSIPELRSIVEKTGRKKMSKELKSRVKSLLERNYVQYTSDEKITYALTEKAISILSSVDGIDENEMSRCLGRPLEVKRFMRERRHLQVTKDVVTYLNKNIKTVSWNFLNTRLKYEDLRYPPRDRGKKVVVEPDAILFVMAGDQTRHIWVEIERGNRKSIDKIDRQLKKYFEITSAKLAPRSLAPIFYVVDAGEKSEARLALIARRLLLLANKYGYEDEPVAIILTTLDELFADIETHLTERVFRTIIAGHREILQLSFQDAYKNWAERYHYFRRGLYRDFAEKLIELIDTY